MKPVAWSYSSLNAFETCPKRYYLTKVSKQVQEPQTQATVWGNKVHKALELRITKGTPLPDTMSEYEPIAQTVAARAQGAKLDAEQKMALTKAFKPTTWFGKDVWVRGITDFTIEKGDKVFIGDWKTGKPTPESAQLKLTAAMTFAHKPHVKTIINSFVWLKTGGNTTEVFQREDVADIWQEFMPRIQRLEHAVEENKFPARPSGLCRAWCPVGKKLCEHCGE
jgi:hypothetical protein